jgi:hypothetical protein
MSDTKSEAGPVLGPRHRMRRGGMIAKRPPFDPRLEAFCTLVWKRYSEGSRAISKQHVYDLYSHYSGARQVEHKGYRKYLSDLLSMTDGCDVTVQFGATMITDPTFPQLMTAYAGGLTGMAALESKSPLAPLPDPVYKMLQEIDSNLGKNSSEVTEKFKQHLERAFFHCSARGGTKPAAAQRIYLNVSPMGAIYVFGFVLNDCVKGMPTAVSQAKIIGPAKAGKRPDAIVIYTKDDAAAMAVVAKLRAWRKATGRDAYFSPGCPPMTLPVADLSGVSLGAEPTMPSDDRLMLTIPSYIGQAYDENAFEFKQVRHLTPQEPRYGHGNEQPFVDGPVSFGSMRSDLIAQAFNAAQEDKESCTLDFFLELVWRYFGAAGLNVLMPHL